MATVVHTTTHFLKRDSLYVTEKPYSLRFTPPDGFPRANIKLEKHDIDIHDVRHKAKNLSFESDGVSVLDFESKMTYEDYDNDITVQEVLLREVANRLKSLLGAQHVQIFEHTLWKPLLGPVQDWPLAMCIPDTMDPNSELEPCDLVFPDYVVENRQVYYSTRQRWFYLSNQMPNEAWVFLQADTKPTVNPVAHTAFPIPHIKPADVPPRESIEVRALVYYGGFDEEQDS